MKQKSYIFAKNYHMNTRSEEPQTISLQRIKALAAILDEQEYGNDVIIGEASETVAGAAGDFTTRLKDKGFPAVVTADGPAGLSLC